MTEDGKERIKAAYITIEESIDKDVTIFLTEDLIKELIKNLQTALE